MGGFNLNTHFLFGGIYLALALAMAVVHFKSFGPTFAAMLGRVEPELAVAGTHNEIDKEVVSPKAGRG